MTAPKIQFLKLSRIDQIENVLKKINSWSNIALYTAPFKDFKIQSLHQANDNFNLTFTALSPREGDCYIQFNIEEHIFQIKGQLQFKNEEYIFNFKEFSRELKRRILRVEIPENYPAHFILHKVAGEFLQEEVQIIDFHNEGLLIGTWNPLTIKVGDIVSGFVRIGKFNEVQASGVTRHCIKKDGRILVGIEFHHHEFGSEEKMMELLTLYKRDSKNVTLS